MATQTCPSCRGSGYNATSGVMPGSQPGRPLCSHCNGRGWIQKPSNGSEYQDCFPGDAMILTPFGQVRLDELSKGDKVLSFTLAGNVVPVTIKRKVSHRAHPILKIVSENPDLSFFATKRHPVHTDRGWIRIKDLKKGDRLAHVNAKRQLIEHSTEIRVKHRNSGQTLISD